MPITLGNVPSVGDVTQLPTDDKTNVVNAIIELESETKDIPFVQLESLVLTNSHITNKSITLDFLPAANSISLTVIGGILQRENIDFMVTGQQLSWENLALELLVSEGSILYISYLRG